MAKRSELPFDREAARIVKVLDRVTRTGRRPGDVFEDWLDLVEACLTQLPAHLKAAVTERKPADDPEEVKALWARVAARYDGYKTQAFEAFSEALGLLLSFSHDEQGQPRYRDFVGEIYMAWGWPNDRMGQYFTPWHVAKAMAEMTVSVEEVHARLKAAIQKSPLAEVMTMVGALVEGPEAQAWFFKRVLPACLEFYEPVTICDPCCGSGVMFLAAASCFPRWMIDYGLVQFYGVDLDRTCVQMAKVNVLLYGLNGSHLRYALALDEASLAALPQVYAQAYAEAQVAEQNGDQARVEAISAGVRQLSFLET